MATLINTTENALGFALKPGGSTGSYIVKSDYVAVKDGRALKDVKTYVDEKISKLPTQEDVNNSILNASVKGGFVLKGTLPTTKDALLNSLKKNVFKSLLTSDPITVDGVVEGTTEYFAPPTDADIPVGTKAYAVVTCMNGYVLVYGTVTPAGIAGNASTTIIEEVERSGTRGPLHDFVTDNSITLATGMVKGYAYVSDATITNQYKENIEAGDMLVMTSPIFTGKDSEYTIVQNNIVGAVTSGNISSYITSLSNAEIDAAIGI